MTAAQNAGAAPEGTSPLRAGRGRPELPPGEQQTPDNQKDGQQDQVPPAD